MRKLWRELREFGLWCYIIAWLVFILAPSLIIDFVDESLQRTKLHRAANEVFESVIYRIEKWLKPRVEALKRERQLQSR